MDLLATCAFVLQLLTPAQWCQAYFVLAAACVLAVAALPPGTRRKLLDYGARGSSGTGKTKLAPPKKSPPGENADWLEKVAAEVTVWGQIPHSWFTFFYAALLACSVFWAHQYAADGYVLRAVASAQAGGVGAGAGQSPQSLQAVHAAWALVALQGARRLLEQLFVLRPSSSTIWFIHWLLGLSFYVFLSVAVWVEGSESLVENASVKALNKTPSLKIIAGSAMFLIASVAQFRCHNHLASLKKYSLPTQGLFRHIVCAHYACECMLYLSLAIVAAPDGQLVNRTLLSALIFVAVNLGVTADGTRRWYKSKFGAEKVAHLWAMIPLVY